MRRRILVSGASVAGLTAAYWLDRLGFAVTVVERSAGLRPGGQALDVRGPALEVARRMGVLDEFRARTTRLRGMSMVDDDGAEIYRTTERTLTGGRLDSEDLEVLRAIPNFLGLDRWQTFYLGAGDAGAGLIGLDGSGTARAYLGFESAQPIEYDYRDEYAQKQLLAERSAGLGWVVPQILEHMRDDASGFHFDARIQVIMKHWTKGRVALVGDAGYAVSLTTGQGASMAMVGAYVLAGEIAASGKDLAAGIARYEDEVRDYVLDQQLAARELNDENRSDDGGSGPGDFTDFGTMVRDLTLKDYLPQAGPV